jgi:hypothetical protein
MLEMILRALASAFLVVVLSLTSVTAAVAHMRAAGAVQIALCGTPGIEEVITLDAFGNPISMMHHCPDCLTLAAGVSPEAPQVARPLGRLMVVRAALANRVAGPNQSLQPAARGPPLVL